MKLRVVVSLFVLLGALTAGTFATSGDGVAPKKQWVLVNFDKPTVVGNTILMGPYLIVHDDDKMARGEPCTSIYRFDPKKGPQEEAVAFHCIPRQRPLTETLKLTVGGGTEVRDLKEYQFAGDTEGHGVPRIF